MISHCLRLGDIAPDFEAETTKGLWTSFHERIRGKWAILFSHPEDFTPVCTTELAEVAKLAPVFKRMEVEVIALSCDTLADHERWIADIESYGGAAVGFPIIADHSRTVAGLYGMLDSNAHDKDNVDADGMPFTVRTVFVIDPQQRVRLMQTYPASCGRNFDEIVRVIESLQSTDRTGLTTPANWKRNDPMIAPPPMPTVTAAQYGSVVEVFEYLRFVKID